MKDTTNMATPRTDSSLAAGLAAGSTSHGILPGVVHLALDVADRSQSTALAVLQDARGEIRTAIEHGIELAEKITSAGFRFTRKLVQRIDEAAGETLASAERVLAGAVKNARETTNAASQLASTPASGVTASA
jgi:hypothetical protein